MTIASGDVFADLDPREVKKGRTLRVERVSSEFAYCVSSTSGRDVRIHLSRLLSSKFRKEAA